MTEYALAPTRDWTFASGYATPRVMLEQGLLAAYRVRSNGTMRHVDLYPLASTLRSAAEWVSDAIEMDGRSVQSVARELHVSAPTVRRYLESLELTEEVEAGDWDDLTFDEQGEPVWAVSEDYEDPYDTDDMGRNVTANDQVEEILDQLAGMGKPADEVLAELEATKAAQAAPKPRTRRTRAPRPIADVVADQGLPYPTDEERAAALADVTPKATPVQAYRATPEGNMVLRNDLHVCYCVAGGSTRHAVGAPGCKNVAAPARRTRSHG